MATTLPYIINPTLLVITIKGVPHMIPTTDERHAPLIELMRDSSIRDSEIEATINVIAKVEKFVKGSKLQVRGTDVYFGERRVTGQLATRIMWHIEQGVGVEPLSNFVEKLYQNPSMRVVNHMYPFMEYGKLALTPCGDFLAYKRVKHNGDGDMVDCHSGKIVNNVGTVVKMERMDVNDDPEQTCSYGLHACSHEYLQSFSGSATVTVQINPAHVVAIPTDYNNTKLRCCEYKVIEVLSEEQVESNVLSTPVMTRATDLDLGLEDEEYGDEEYVNPDNEELESQTGVADSPTPDMRWEVHQGTFVEGQSIRNSWTYVKTINAAPSRSQARTIAGTTNTTLTGNNITRVYDTSTARYI